MLESQSLEQSQIMHNCEVTRQQRTYHPQQHHLNSNRLNSHHQSQSKVLFLQRLEKGFYSPFSQETQFLPQAILRQHETVLFFLVNIFTTGWSNKTEEIRSDQNFIISFSPSVHFSFSMEITKRR